MSGTWKPWCDEIARRERWESDNGLTHAHRSGFGAGGAADSPDASLKALGWLRDRRIFPTTSRLKEGVRHAAGGGVPWLPYAGRSEGWWPRRRSEA